MSLRDIFAKKTNLNELADSTAIHWLAIALIIIGFLSRLSPILDIEHHIFWQFMTEDGYLMQTIARNMALGLGMSTAEGTLPTNGVQPLATLAYALLHYIADGSKQLGILYLTVFSALVALVASWLLKGLAITLFKPWKISANIAFLLAALWFASPLIIKHSMNGLETGVYFLAIIASLYYYFSLDLQSNQPMSAAQRVILGGLLGLTFLARNDAVFFIAALLVAHVLSSNTNIFEHLKFRINDAVVAGITSIFIGLPWLIYNQLNFGSIIPMSGKAESHAAVFGENFMMTPANALESALVYFPIPRSLEETLPVFILSVSILILFSVMFWKIFAVKSLNAKRFFVTTYIFTLCISAYYGLVFGAAWFVTRYLSALSPMLWLISFMVVYVLLSNFFSKQQFAKILLFIASALTAISVVSQVSGYQHGTQGPHKQVVDWTLLHINKEIWVGAAQTGTLGFFHDRTINLDGKTNLDALKAIIRDGQVQSYVLDKTNIEYIVDWEGICGWTKEIREPRFGEQFKVLIADPEKNLCVMHRSK